MRKELFVPGLAFALSVAGAAWAIPPTTVANVISVPTEATTGTTIIGRVTSVGSSGRSVTIETASGSTALSAITAGDEVQFLLASNPPSANAIGVPPGEAPHAGTVSADRARHLNADPSRRVLGVWLLAMSGAAIMLRVRRQRTFLISADGGRKPVGAPATNHAPVSSFV